MHIIIICASSDHYNEMLMISKNVYIQHVKYHAFSTSQCQALSLFEKRHLFSSFSSHGFQQLVLLHTDSDTKKMLPSSSVEISVPSKQYFALFTVPFRGCSSTHHCSCSTLNCACLSRLKEGKGKVQFMASFSNNCVLFVQTQF